MRPLAQSGFSGQHVKWHTSAFTRDGTLFRIACRRIKARDAATSSATEVDKWGL
jgi:hypothetical protein